MQSSAVLLNRTYFHRCWTYWDTGLTNGLGRMTPVTLPGYIWLAGRQAVRQPANDGLSAIVMAPVSTRLGAGNYQLAVFEGLSRTQTWSPTVTFSILNGNLTSDANSAWFLTTASNSMYIPTNAR